MHLGQIFFPLNTVMSLVASQKTQLGLYFLAKLLTDGRFHYDLSIFLDDKIPFVPFFMLIYWGAYFSWGINYILAARENRDHCRRCITADMIAKALCFDLPAAAHHHRPAGGRRKRTHRLAHSHHLHGGHACDSVPIHPLPGFLAVLAVFSEV